MYKNPPLYAYIYIYIYIDILKDTDNFQINNPVYLT